MFKFLAKFFDENNKTLKRYQTIISSINVLEPSISSLTYKELANKTYELKQAIAQGKTLDEILPTAFAVVREASKRSIGLRHYDVQLMAGIAFHEGKIAEQKTGEGKTLSATLALYINALEGKGAHLVTVNDYLAQLGAGWMGPIFELLGLSVGVIIHDLAYLYDSNIKKEERGDDRLEHFKTVPRNEAYAADITYGTNNEFGFDYLRDNMAQKAEHTVQRKLHYAIVDEADSILIDEARTPLIISAPDVEPTKKYYTFAQLIETLTKDSDYTVDEKMKIATLTDLGIKRVEKKLNISNLYEEDFDIIHHIEQALKAKSLFQRDKDYIVRKGEVIIVDEHTGRLMYGRRYSDGLHQAIEAKEGVQIQQESRTLATISLQNYFRLYKKLSGMTGTAETESEEFKKIYNVDVVVMPTNVPVQRKDYSDVIYKTTRGKYAAIVHEVASLYAKNQPVLIGTRSIQHNEIIAQLLTRNKIPHNVLNAKNHEKEAFIIADAGRPGAITVATNIAGRGVDIVLGGAKPDHSDFEKEKDYQKELAIWKKRNEKVIDAGGLYVLGTERHESRRIDNQLRGRSGRQGDPGASKFFVSLEDEIMRLFGGEQISKVMEFLKLDENQPIEHAMISKAIEQAQVKVEGFFFDQRKRLVEFDDVMNKQREVIYARRKSILEEKREIKTEFMENLHATLTTIVTLHQEDLDSLLNEFHTIIPFDDYSQKEIKNQLEKQFSAEEKIAFLHSVANKLYEQRKKELGNQVIRDIERYVVLTTLDEQWMEHLDSMDNLREGIWLRGDKQTVLSSYKQEAFEMFSSLMGRIDDEVVHRMYRVQINKPVETPSQSTVEIKQEVFSDSLAQEAEQAKQAVSTPSSTQGSTTDFAGALGKAVIPQQTIKPGIAKAKIGRNDPCPCGSGKKYKKCHMLTFSPR